MKSAKMEQSSNDNKQFQTPDKYIEDMIMKLFRSKVWSPVDIACLKWCCILIGMIAGAYFSDFTKRYIWIFIIIAILLAIKPMVSYFRNSE
jgi:hypothetical protein